MKSISNKIEITLGFIALLCCLTLIRTPFARAQDDATSSAPIDTVTTNGTSTDNASGPTDVSTTTPPEPASSSTPTDTTPAEKAASSSPQSNQSAPQGLTLVHIIGTKYTDDFTDGTTVISYPGDPDVDSNLSKPDAPVPTHAGLRWVQTTTGYLYDTPSGDLEVGEYAVQPNGQYIENEPPHVSPTSTPAAISTAVAQGNNKTSGDSTASSTATQSTSGADATTSSTQDD